jgi:hypothetical protein
MSGLRIMFEVDEKHVGSCLVALEGRAKNLNFEVIQELEWQKNKGGRGPGKHNGKEKLSADFVLGQMSLAAGGLTKAYLLEAIKKAGLKPQGLNSIMLSLVGKKLVKKSGQTYLLLAKP